MFFFNPDSSDIYHLYATWYHHLPVVVSDMNREPYATLVMKNIKIDSSEVDLRKSLPDIDFKISIKQTTRTRRIAET